MKTSRNKQYWLDLVGMMINGKMLVKPLSWMRDQDFLMSAIQEHQLAELLIPYHAPDGKKYGFTVYLADRPNGMPCISEMLVLQEMAPDIAKTFGGLCQEVAV